MSSIKIRSKRKAGKTEIRTLIAHPMEHGRNRDPVTKELIPAHFIKTLIVRHNDKTVVTSHMAGSISKDPYFAFLLNSSAAGDKIEINWVDNLGQMDSEIHILK
ncbi:thiosulfate oxidation carrier complex protein SoxZ [Methylicorpusculum oleiharenae]|uniref:thiosulfate oxidation carrier complex protein SoxZ n=1 Tax=Methylicorpusculum oleiharenae TaxID=1338687 RepID=UPI00135B6129|nr:thiosulfate oxidation carrier complex protein SoxZ [Methylicorpusculum oleiharenae]MCD2451032.1 thiosulfate oxidation carrier complex protein SoxZ [Methylicorpusculum oleiharenae]